MPDPCIRVVLCRYFCMHAVSRASPTAYYTMAVDSYKNNQPDHCFRPFATFGNHNHPFPGLIFPTNGNLDFVMCAMSYSATIVIFFDPYWDGNARERQGPCESHEHNSGIVAAQFAGVSWLHIVKTNQATLWGQYHLNPGSGIKSRYWRSIRAMALISWQGNEIAFRFSTYLLFCWGSGVNLVLQSVGHVTTSYCAEKSLCAKLPRKISMAFLQTIWHRWIGQLKGIGH